MDADSSADRQTNPEEIVSAVTHGIGAAFSIVGLVLLVSIAAKKGDAWRITSFSIYGATLILLYMMSMLFHAISGPAKRFFQFMDGAAVYLLIAGTYTPVALIFLRGVWGWSMLGIIWGLAIIGILLKIFSVGKFNVVTTIVYVIMGWLIVIAVKPLMSAAPRELLVWIVVGGTCYTMGVVFYLLKKMPFHHPVWHLFVLGGSVCHFLGFLWYGMG
ncbi:MAG: hemolysin III family protein [Spirochaetes bacterium]|nr:hemolysin III family protein [Spirochaetota bacterium]